MTTKMNRFQNLIENDKYMKMRFSSLLTDRDGKDIMNAVNFIGATMNDATFWQFLYDLDIITCGDTTQPDTEIKSANLCCDDDYLAVELDYGTRSVSIILDSPENTPMYQMMVRKKSVYSDMVARAFLYISELNASSAKEFSICQK